MSSAIECSSAPFMPKSLVVLPIAIIKVLYLKVRRGITSAPSSSKYGAMVTSFVARFKPSIRPNLKRKWCQCACAIYSSSCFSGLMLPAAISCNSGFHTCVLVLSIKVIAAFLFLPRLSPKRVASSKPPAPPPTITM